MATTPDRPGRALDQAFRRADRGVLFYGLTPPRRATSAERAGEIAAATLQRLEPLGLDALIVYDVDDEDGRADTERPFPFVPMMDPSDFADAHLATWTAPLVVYRAVAKYTQDELGRWLAGAHPDRVATVLVGAGSGREGRTALGEAYDLHRRTAPGLGLGGVLIAERHAARYDEHVRMLRKQEAGAAFFVSQICYDLDHTRDVLSDYAHTCRARGVDPRPVVLTLAPCGSAKTLEFLTWLGVDVPRWVRNDILHADDPLEASFEQCLSSARVLSSFCRRLGLPFGLNVESVTNRKVEIEASVVLAAEIRGVLGRS